MKIAFVVAEDINLGAGYIMAHLRKEGHDVRLFFDPLQFKRGYIRNRILSKLFNIENNILHRIKRYNPDTCLFSCVTATYQWGLHLAKKIKKQNNCKIIFGGVHATLVPEEVKKHTWIDEVVTGDGLRYFGGKFDPDNLWPDRESFLKVLPPEHRKAQLFMTSFGCPFNCSFCGNEQLRKMKQHTYFRRTPAGCIKELKHLKERGMRHVLFVDDIFTCSKPFLNSFLPAYRDEISLPFTCFGHPDYLDREIVSQLKEAGCHTIWIGIQSGDERLRSQVLHRREKNKRIIEVCELIKKYKIKLIVDHIFGIPTENAMSQDISYNLYSKIKADIINCYELLYFPKAKIIEYALRYAYLMPSDVEKINQGKGIVYQTGNKGSQFYTEYAKSFCAIPVGGIAAELLPMPIIKLIAHIKAGHGYIPIAMIQNEIYFTFQALKRKVGL